MRKIYIPFIFLFALSCFLPEVKAQDPMFTQFYANPLYLNPAFAGSARCPRFVANYRNQWPSLYKTYITSCFSYDQHFDAISGGLGFQIYNDRAGDNTINTTNISAQYAYQLNVTRNLSIDFGFQATYMQKTLDWSKLTFGDMIDKRSGFIYPTNEAVPGNNTTNRGYPDFSAGLLAYSTKYFVGIAVHHLTQPQEGFISNDKSPLPMKITGHAGILIPIGDKQSETSISPNLLFRRQQSFQELNLGVYVNKGPLVAGIWYRNSDAFIVTLGMATSLFKFGYSYDVTVSKLGVSNTAGSHEISATVQLHCHKKKKRFRAVSCPSF